jgi:hypothetical protein
MSAADIAVKGQNSRLLQFFGSKLVESKPNGIFVPLAGVLADEFTDSSAITLGKGRDHEIQVQRQ